MLGRDCVHWKELLLSRVSAVLMVLALVLVAAGLAPAAVAQTEPADLKVYLRRATFDPLRGAPVSSSARSEAQETNLLLVQFDHPPTEETRRALVGLGLRPLVYVPENTLLVRVTGDRAPALGVLAGLRWSGAFLSSYKLPAELDLSVRSEASGVLDARLVAAPDADLDALMTFLEGRGAHVGGWSASLNGAVLRARLPAVALADVIARDDVLWVERAAELRAANDRARAILGVTEARQAAGWLDGAGQIIAVTDTGLDLQGKVSADFAGRVVRAFTPAQMNPSCGSNSAAATWSDRNGHGTHVAGTALGSGALSPAGQYAGMAPGAGLVVQAVSTGGAGLNCFPDDAAYLSKAYDAGARVQNASWGAPAGGAYGAFEQELDDYLWQHKEHLFVVVGGNSGADVDRNGVIDHDSIDSPGTAKNVLSVGSSENDRPPTGDSCVPPGGGSDQQNACWSSSKYGSPIGGDFVSDDARGIAAFSSRGPTDDGRIKPEIVAPGTNVISSASHDPAAFYDYGKLNGDYAYDNGTSMSAPMVSGLAALVRQWLERARGMGAPSSALVKALLLNGATDMSPGQYGTGGTREIPAAWPNNVEGWGRAALLDSVDLSGGQRIWLADVRSGIARAGEQAPFLVYVRAGQPLRVSLAWTDYPAFAAGSRTLVNDLDLEVRAPDGTVRRGNASAELAAECRDAAGADRCNNVESVTIAAPASGFYTIRVRGASIIQGPQPFAVVARAQSVVDRGPEQRFLPRITR
jgi:subtilisin family serine protease